MVTAAWSAPQGYLPFTLVRRFIAADWTLAGAAAVDEMHLYSARFVRENPGLATELFRPQLAVLDPFCGSGTTLEAAISTGTRATGGRVIDNRSLAER